MTQGCDVAHQGCSLLPPQMHIDHAISTNQSSYVESAGDPGLKSIPSTARVLTTSHMRGLTNTTAQNGRGGGECGRD